MKGSLTKTNILVPAQNSVANTTQAEVIGNKTDNEAGNSVYAKLYTLSDHIHSACKVYPTLAAGVTLTTAAGAWALSAAWAEVVPVNTITSVFDIHQVHIGDYSANSTYEVVFASGGAGAETEIGRVRFTRISNTNPGAYLPFMTPLVAANSRISAKIACAAGGAATAVVSIFYHTY